MKRTWILIILGIVIAVLGVGAYFLFSPSGLDILRISQRTNPPATKKACDIFTNDIAQKVLGEGIRKVETVSEAEVSTDGVDLTSCAFEREQDGSLQVASVVVHGAKTADAYNINRSGFYSDQDRSSVGEASIQYVPTEPIQGLGDAAFYDPEFKQVNTLIKNGQYWIIAQTDQGQEKADQLAREVAKGL